MAGRAFERQLHAHRHLRILNFRLLGLSPKPPLCYRFHDRLCSHVHRFPGQHEQSAGDQREILKRNLKEDIIKMNKSLSWKFPQREYIMLKLEMIFILLFSLLIFVSVWVESHNWFYSLLLTILFLAIYVLAAAVIQKIRKPSEHYQLSRTHLQITRKTKRKTKKVKLPWKEVKHHKLDRFFLGGYVLTKTGKRHSLFFNRKKEVDQFEKYVKRLLKKRR